MRSWSPYAVGAGIGVLSWFAFATADRHLAITLQYEHVAAMIERAAVPPVEQTNGYYAARAQQGLSPNVGCYMMLIVGVFLGALLSPRLPGTRSDASVPPLWGRRFGPSATKRFAFAFL